MKPKKEKDAIEHENNSLQEATAVSIPNDFFNIKEAALYLRCSMSKLYTQVERGTIPFIRNEGQIIFYKQDLIDWLKTKRYGIPLNFVSGLYETSPLPRACQ